MTMLTVTGLYRYPLKSCRGQSLTDGQLTRYGLEWHRQWMIVDDKGRFLSQRRLPAMALIDAEPVSEGLILQAPDRAPLTVGTKPDSIRKVRVWGDEPLADDLGDQAADWLSEYLGIACRLVTRGSAFTRPVDPDYDRWDSEVQFADGFPLLLISQASLDDLNSRLPEPVPMNRFRPNLVVSGCEPYAEDQWQQIEIGGITFEVVKPCSRCTIPQVDQATGERGDEPTRTLATYRRRTDKKIYFGQNLIHRGVGQISLNDPVIVVR